MLYRTFAVVLERCASGQTTDCVQLPGVDAGASQIQTALQIAFGIIGAVALIYMALAGLKFITSQGRPEVIAQARQSIIYGAIGLVIAVSAEIIVTFVLGRI